MTILAYYCTNLISQVRSSQFVSTFIFQSTNIGITALLLPIRLRTQFSRDTHTHTPAFSLSKAFQSLVLIAPKLYPCLWKTYNGK